jgi:hypothetical protein
MELVASPPIENYVEEFGRVSPVHCMDKTHHLLNCAVVIRKYRNS